MFTVKIRSDFSSAHNLRGYKGKCEDLHGHNWQVEVSVRSDKLDGTGMVMDFKELKATVEDVLSELDHKYLNEIEYFRDANPTSENIARYIYDKVRAARPGITMDSVTIWETGSSAATYME